MKTNLNLDFLYYQEQQILDGKDPNMETYEEQEDTFIDFVSTKPLSDVIKLFILSYKEKYAQHNFFAGCFYDIKTGMEQSTEPENIGEHDFFMSKEKMTRKDIEHIILRIFKDDYEKTNTRFLKELELVFTEPQDFNNAITNALAGKDFSINELEGRKLFIIENSAISEIEISPLKFVLRTNSEKWVAYYGW
ncbi:DUF4070 domain-containing protein [Psychroserpens algicola]|uniref:DUF4070 domain-containing protein n=1 Tax=Psychroserpens algicola TaxID=1719034 RepID=A0ABT0HD66_9FLAO|nr:hypothetical protein [Psychroserpens algicola]MCK8482295.1 hypothetical protein [Psychroserpens algicola]